MKKKKITLENLAGLIRGTEQRLGDNIEKLAVIVVNKFDNVDKQFDGVNGRLDKVEGKVGKLETRMAIVEYGQYEIKKKLDIVPTRFEMAKMEMKFEKRFQKIEAKIGIKQKAK